MSHLVRRCTLVFNTKAPAIAWAWTDPRDPRDEALVTLLLALHEEALEIEDTKHVGDMLRAISEAHLARRAVGIDALGATAPVVKQVRQTLTLAGDCRRQLATAAGAMWKDPRCATSHEVEIILKTLWQTMHDEPHTRARFLDLLINFDHQREWELHVPCIASNIFFRHLVPTNKTTRADGIAAFLNSYRAYEAQQFMEPSDNFDPPTQLLTTRLEDAGLGPGAPASSNLPTSATPLPPLLIPQLSFPHPSAPSFPGCRQPRVRVRPPQVRASVTVLSSWACSV